MAFVFLKSGDALPSVATVQILLRRHRPNTLITADGQFGPRTKAAVEGYQGARPPLTKDGVIGPNTWNSFLAASKFQTIDLVDGTDPSLVQLEAADIRAAGGDPIVVFGQSNGLNFAMQQVAARGRTGNVMLLRIHGHGNRGLQNVTGGEINGAPHMASIALSNYGQAEPSLLLIRSKLLKFGSVQLLGCDVGGGKGVHLVTRLAQTWGVPVTAGLHTQFGGGSKTFRFEGPTVSGFPPGLNLKSWAAEMEAEFGNVSVPD
jgi:peptidoglycan hydrolase-like protein with peptidoglycan-binding domain